MEYPSFLHLKHAILSTVLLSDPGMISDSWANCKPFTCPFLPRFYPYPCHLSILYLDQNPCVFCPCPMVSCYVNYYVFSSSSYVSCSVFGYTSILNECWSYMLVNSLVNFVVFDLFMSTTTIIFSLTISLYSPTYMTNIHSI